MLFIDICELQDFHLFHFHSIKSHINFFSYFDEFLLIVFIQTAYSLEGQFLFLFIIVSATLFIGSILFEFWLLFEVEILVVKDFQGIVNDTQEHIFDFVAIWRKLEDMAVPLHFTE